MQRHASLRGFQLLFAQLSASRNETAFAVVAHPTRKVVVVAVRGTNDLSDAMIDARALGQRLSLKRMGGAGVVDGWAHCGMLTAARLLFNELFEPLTLLHEAGHQLLLTGHSLGAGVAVLLAALLREKMGDVQCVGYATPPVASGEGLLEELSSFCTSLVNRNDLIPRMTIRCGWRGEGMPEGWNSHYISLEAYAHHRLNVSQSYLAKHTTLRYTTLQTPHTARPSTTRTLHLHTTSHHHYISIPPHLHSTPPPHHHTTTPHLHTYTSTPHLHTTPPPHHLTTPPPHHHTTHHTSRTTTHHSTTPPYILTTPHTTTPPHNHNLPPHPTPSPPHQTVSTTSNSRPPLSFQNSPTRPPTHPNTSESTHVEVL